TAVVTPNLTYRASEPTWQYQYFLPNTHNPASDLPAEPAEIVQFFVSWIVWSVHPLNRQAKAIQIPVARNVDSLEIPQQCGTLIPRCVVRRLHDVVAIERTNRDELHILDVQPRQELFELLADFEKPIFAPIHEIHLVDGDHQMGDPK